jgi:DNA-directed RNA polymerase specialized sigma24 family protein
MVLRRIGRALTAQAFGKFFRWLSENDEKAVLEYQTIRAKLVRYFVHKGCSDPDDLFDKTIDVVVGKIDTLGECPSALAYCFGVAKNIWRQDLRERSLASLEDNVAVPTDPYPEIHERELNCLEHCMDKLLASDRDVLIQYHQGQGHDKIEVRKHLANTLGGVNALRIRMCRIRRDLRLCVAACIEQSSN